MEIAYRTKMSANSTSHPNISGNIEETHTRSEIIHHANEILAQQMGLDLCFFVGLEMALIPGEDGDDVIYVDKSGKRIEFTEELQFEAAIAVLNSNGHYFEAPPVNETRSGFA